VTTVLALSWRWLWLGAVVWAVFLAGFVVGAWWAGVHR
jgi:hypothetical protein